MSCGVGRLNSRLDSESDIAKLIRVGWLCWRVLASWVVVELEQKWDCFEPDLLEFQKIRRFLL